ncbi:MAG: hypothetical protein ACYTHM_20785 [Planctomycetota bacterium]|jgi:hypothetical protein
MNEEERKPKPQPLRGKIPPLPPILVGAGFLGENDEEDFIRLASEYANADFLEEEEMLREINEEVVDEYNKVFTEKVEISFCLNCGSLKMGPWNLCAACGFKPRSLEELAMHFATTAFDPKIMKNDDEYRRNLGRRRIEENPNFVNNLASGILMKMKPVLESL